MRHVQSKGRKSLLTSKSSFDECELIMKYLKVNTISLSYIIESILRRYEANTNNIKVPNIIYLKYLLQRSPKHFLYKDSTKTIWYGASKAADYLIKYYAAKFFGKLILIVLSLSG